MLSRPCFDFFAVFFNSIVFAGVGPSSASDLLMFPADGTAERSSAPALLAGEESAQLVFQMFFTIFGNVLEIENSST